MYLTIHVNHILTTMVEMKSDEFICKEYLQLKSQQKKTYKKF